MRLVGKSSPEVILGREIKSWCVEDAKVLARVLLTADLNNYNNAR